VTNDTALAVRENGVGGIESWGKGDTLDRLAKRFIEFFQIGDPKKPQQEQEKERTLALPAALAAAQQIVRFGLTPMTHVYIVKRGGKYQAEYALEAWKAWADRHAFLGKFRYDVQFRQMTPEEVRAYTPPAVRYTSEDFGFLARVIRFDIAREYKELGLTYDPPWYTGFWRKEAVEEQRYDEGRRQYVKTGKWQPDQLPNQRTPADVAQRRAMRSALKANFTPIEIDDFENRMGSVERAAEWRAAVAMNAMIPPEPKVEDNHLFLSVAPGQTVLDEDGVFAVEPPRTNGKRPAQPPVLDDEGDEYTEYTDVPPMNDVAEMAVGSGPDDGWGDWVGANEFTAAIKWAVDRGKFPTFNAASADFDAVGEGMHPSEALAAWRMYVNQLPAYVESWRTWESSADAYAWAIAIGACANEFEAKNSMGKIVAAEGGKNADKARVFEAFYNRQNDKLAMGQ